MGHRPLGEINTFAEERDGVGQRSMWSTFQLPSKVETWKGINRSLRKASSPSSAFFEILGRSHTS